MRTPHPHQSCACAARGPLATAAAAGASNLPSAVVTAPSYRPPRRRPRSAPQSAPGLRVEVAGPVRTPTLATGTRPPPRLDSARTCLGQFSDVGSPAFPGRPRRRPRSRHLRWALKYASRVPARSSADPDDPSTPTSKRTHIRGQVVLDPTTPNARRSRNWASTPKPARRQGGCYETTRRSSNGDSRLHHRAPVATRRREAPRGVA